MGMRQQSQPGTPTHFPHKRHGLLAVVGKRCDEGNHSAVEPSDGTRQDIAPIVVAKVTAMLSLDVQGAFVSLCGEWNLFVILLLLLHFIFSKPNIMPYTKSRIMSNSEKSYQ